MKYFHCVSITLSIEHWKSQQDEAHGNGQIFDEFLVPLDKQDGRITKNRKWLQQKLQMLLERNAGVTFFIYDLILCLYKKVWRFDEKKNQIQQKLNLFLNRKILLS